MNDYIRHYKESLIKNYMNLPPENETDKVEYKRFLTNFNKSKINRRTSQMMNRLAEGYEEDGRSNCIYLLGINDNGAVFGLDKKYVKESMKNIKNFITTIQKISTQHKKNN